MRANFWNKLRGCIILALSTGLLAWLGILTIASQIYVHGLTHPACVTSAHQPDGYQSIQLMPERDLSLPGYWRPPSANSDPPGSVIIVLGGNGASRDTMLPTADLLARHGFGVITLDYRSCVGQPSSLGYNETGDLKAAVDFAWSQPGTLRVGVLGSSVGGITAIRGAARLNRIGAVVAMGGYSSLDQQIDQESAPPLSSRWIVQRLIPIFFRFETGVNTSQLRPVDDVAAISPRPLLLIYGDEEIAQGGGREQYEAARQPKELWIVPHTGHEGYLKNYPVEFEEKVVKFFIDGLKK